MKRRKEKAVSQSKELEQSIVYNTLYNIVENNIDISNRIIYLYQEIDQELSKNIVGCFNMLIGRGKEPITLEINCEGGEVYPGLAIVDMIKNCPVEVIGKARGYCMSMATNILAVCHKRYAYPFTQFMIHQIGGGINADKLNSMKVELRHVNQLEKTLNNIYYTHTKITKKHLNKYAKNEDYYFDANTALELRLIDEIL